MSMVYRVVGGLGGFPPENIEERTGGQHSRVVSCGGGRGGGGGSVEEWTGNSKNGKCDDRKAKTRYKYKPCGARPPSSLTDFGLKGLECLYGTL